MSVIEFPVISLRRTATVYFAVQGTAVALWWVLLLLAPGTRAPFLPRGAGEPALLAFWLPDLLLMGAGSGVTALFCARDSRWMIHSLWLLAGVVGYAGLYCVSASLLTDSAWLGVVLMTPAVVLTTLLAVLLGLPSRRLFRPAAPADPGWNFVKTAAQIVFVWGLSLGVIPLLILLVEERAGIGRIRFAGQEAGAVALFVVTSALNLWSASTMVRLGHGTPLPTDGARRLVTSGPYAYVRNPMAVAGLGQGAAIALAAGSGLVLGYVLLGAAVWQWIVRPLEEEHLQAQFGSEFLDYRRAVGCWWPRPVKRVRNGVR